MSSEEKLEPRVVMVERPGSVVLPFLAGAAVGVVLGLLFAPGAGAETRRVLGDRARRLRERVGGTLDEAFAEARRRMSEGVSATRRAVEEQADEVRRVFEAGRAAAQEARQQLRRRRAEERQRAGAEPRESMPPGS